MWIGLRQLGLFSVSSEVSDFRIIPVEHWILLRERASGGLDRCVMCIKSQ